MTMVRLFPEKLRRRMKFNPAAIVMENPGKLEALTSQSYLALGDSFIMIVVLTSDKFYKVSLKLIYDMPQKLK